MLKFCIICKTACPQYAICLVKIPCNMLRSGENVFLDDLTVEDVSEAIGREIVIVEEDGEDLVSSVLDPVQNKKQTRRQMYEQTSSSNSGQA